MIITITYKSIKWDYINTLESELDKRKAISKYLSKSITGMLRDEVNKNVDGMKKPIKGIWNNKDKKRVKNGFDYLSILFPQWFDTSTINMVDEEVYDFDYEKLGEYFDDWLQRHLPKYHLMVKMFFGLDDIFSKPKKISEIADPMFKKFNARILFQPVMTFEDLKKKVPKNIHLLIMMYSLVYKRLHIDFNNMFEKISKTLW